MRCLACGSEMGERNICQVCGTPKKNVLCNNDISSMEPGTEIMYENIRHYSVQKNEAGQKEMEGTDVNGENETSVIPISGYAEKKKLHSGKRKGIKIIFFASLGVTITIAAVIVFLFIRKEKEYKDSLPEYSLTFYDENSDIVYDENLIPLYYGKNNYDYVCISDNNSKMFFLEEGVLINRLNDIDKIIDENVVEYIGNSNWEYILYAKQGENGISVFLEDENRKLLVIENLYNIDNLVVSDNGEYFAFRTTWTYEKWIDDSQLPEGGEYVTVTVYELYSVNKAGDYKLRVQSEDKLECNYITNKGELLYNNFTADEMCVESSGSITGIYSAINKMVYNEKLDSAVLVSTNGDLVYWLKNEGLLTLISSGVEELYYIDSHGGYCELYDVTNVESTRSDILCVFYCKGNNKYYIDLNKMTDSRLLTNEEFCFDNLQLINEEQFYYVDGNIILYELKDDNWISKDSELLYYNRCGRGYLTYENGSIIYNYKNKSETICDGDEILAFVEEMVFYRVGDDVYKININGKSEAELIFNNIVEIQVNYE